MSIKLLEELLLSKRQEKGIAKNIQEYLGDYDLQTIKVEDMTKDIDYVVKTNFYHRLFIYDSNFEYYYTSFLNEEITYNKTLLNLKLEHLNIKKLFYNLKFGKIKKKYKSRLFTNKINFFKNNKKIIRKLIHYYEYNVINFKDDHFNENLVYFDEQYVNGKIYERPKINGIYI